MSRLYWPLHAICFVALVGWAFTSGEPYIVAPRFHRGLALVWPVSACVLFVWNLTLKIRAHRRSAASPVASPPG